MKKIAIIGAGGHAKVLIDTLLKSNSAQSIILFDNDKEKLGSKILNCTVAGNDEDLKKIDPNDVLLVNAIGTVHASGIRDKVFQEFKNLGYSFLTVIHPSAIIADSVEIAEGAQVMANTTIQPGCHIGENSIINTSASIDHDCQIGRSSHIAPGVTLSGGVEVGNGSHVGTGANVIQNIQIGSEATVAAGATVVKNVENHTTVKGCPAR